jgi:hypothetical protein
MRVSVQRCSGVRITGWTMEDADRRSTLFNDYPMEGEARGEGRAAALPDHDRFPRPCDQSRLATNVEGLPQSPVCTLRMSDVIGHREVRGRSPLPGLERHNVAGGRGERTHFRPPGFEGTGAASPRANRPRASPVVRLEGCPSATAAHSMEPGSFCRWEPESG